MRSLLGLLKKYNYVLVFILLEIIAIMLLSNHNSYQHSRLINTNREISGRIYDKVDGAREYLSLKKNNEILLKENTQLRNKLEARMQFLPDSLQLLQADSSELVDSSYHFQEARIVHATFYKQMNYLTLDKGWKQNVNRDMAVISESGIVGIILESSANYSTVIPIINRDFRLSVKLKKSNYAGIIEWDGSSPDYAHLNEIPYHAKLAPGDSIVTSGFSAIFPEGMFVGTIDSFSLQEGNFYNIIIKLGTDYRSLFHVNIISNYKRQERVELEEALEK